MSTINQLAPLYGSPTLIACLPATFMKTVALIIPLLAAAGAAEFDTNNLKVWFTFKPVTRPATISIWGTNAAQVNVILKQYDGSTNQHPSYQFPDMSATNLEIITTHQPVLAGGSNGAWVIRFKP